MIAGLGTHEEQLKREVLAFVCTNETFNAVQHKPTLPQLEVIAKYQATYLAAYGAMPFGLHYFPLPEQDEEVAAVWFPLP